MVEVEEGDGAEQGQAALSCVGRVELVCQNAGAYSRSQLANTNRPTPRTAPRLSRLAIYRPTFLFGLYPSCPTGLTCPSVPMLDNGCGPRSSGATHNGEPSFLDASATYSPYIPRSLLPNPRWTRSWPVPSSRCPQTAWSSTETHGSRCGDGVLVMAPLKPCTGWSHVHWMALCRQRRMQASRTRPSPPGPGGHECPRSLPCVLWRSGLPTRLQPRRRVHTRPLCWHLLLTAPFFV